ncbi:MAG: SUMF1/EgtB/PvdO family nonheme iron enzyme [Nitrospirota bacterium]
MVRIALAACFILLIGLAQEELASAQDIARLQSGVVKITAKPPQGTPNVGTGFIVRLETNAAYIVTAAHVVAGDPQPKVEFFTKRNIPVVAEVLGLEGNDEVRGLALVVVRGTENLPKGITELSLAGAARLTGGEDIVVIGFPRNAALWAIVNGNISSRHGRDILFSPSVESGHSGGPIFQGSKVVGVVGSESQSVGRGVTVGSVEDFIDGFGIMAQESRSSASMPTESSPSPAATAKPEPRQMTQDREITGKDGAPMVRIPAGSFMMGSTKDEVDRAINDCIEELGLNQERCQGIYKSELHRHQVSLNAFYLDKYEVTNQLFNQFVEQSGYRTTAEWERSAGVFVGGKKGWEETEGANWQKPEAGVTVFDSNRAEHPVVSVSWDDGVSYCRWANKRLPTEAEFEYAMRAGTTTTYWWGHGNPGSRRVENIADEAAKNLLKNIMKGYDDGSVRTAVVGSYEANPWGLHDISGNVEEWVVDWYAPYYDKGPEVNPQGPPSGVHHVSRGGAWTNRPSAVRSANRVWRQRFTRNGLIGFRCAQDVPK